MGNFRYSKLHGLNACPSICFFCGEPDGSVVVCGELPLDEQAQPHGKCASTRPCEDCEVWMEYGVLMIPVLTSSAGKAAVPTRAGPMVVMPDEIIKRFIANEHQRTTMLRERWAFIDDDALETLEAWI